MSIAKQFEDTLAAAGQSAHRQMSQWGLTLAVVTNITDDKKLNRVKCLPIMNEKVEETDWCYVMTPFGGKAHGQFFFPNVDDLVILGYLGGDPHRPVVLGGYWNSEVTPPYTIEDGKVHNYSIKTPGGTELLFYDEKGKEKVTLTLPSGAVLAVDDENKTATLSDKDKANALSLDFGKGEIKLAADTKLTLSAGETTIVLESSGKITGKSTTKIAVESATIEGKASAKLALAGATSEVKADATLTLQASGPASLKGAIVKIN